VTGWRVKGSLLREFASGESAPACDGAHFGIARDLHERITKELPGQTANRQGRWPRTSSGRKLK
jgi:hypothetical protein